jgi:UDP-3-O-[3-hydroxymyristoyl] glucosamine N-acyltransferase
MKSSFPRKLDTPISVSWLLEELPTGIVSISGSIETMISSVTAFDQGVPGALVFFHSDSSRSAGLVSGSRASVVVTSHDCPAPDGQCFIRASNPRYWYVKALHKLFPVNSSHRIASSASIATTAQIGDNLEIGANSVVGEGVSIGSDSRIGCGVHIHDGVTIGDGCNIEDNCIIGGDGLAVAVDDAEKRMDFPHLGQVSIEDDVRIGPGSCVVRGLLKDTRIRRGSRLGNLVNVGHNCDIGEDCWISSNTVLCGSVVLEPNVMIGASATINNHVRIGQSAQIGLGSVVTKNVNADTGVFGVPAKRIRAMRKF